MTYPLPSQEAVRELFSVLLGRGVAIDKSPRLKFDPKLPGIAGVYFTDAGALAAVVVADSGLACWAGAAMTLVPAIVVKDHVKRHAVPEQFADNFREILNIIASLLNSPTTPHVRLCDVHVLPDFVSASVTDLLATPAGRRDFTIAIEGYGEGSLTIVTN